VTERKAELDDHLSRTCARVRPKSNHYHDSGSPPGRKIEAGDWI